MLASNRLALCTGVLVCESLTCWELGGGGEYIGVRSIPLLYTSLSMLSGDPRVDRTDVGRAQGDREPLDLCSESLSMSTSGLWQLELMVVWLRGLKRAL